MLFLGKILFTPTVNVHNTYVQDVVIEKFFCRLQNIMFLDQYFSDHILKTLCRRG